MKVLIAMSGGVDSSVAAKILYDEGYECIGCTMKLYNGEDSGGRQNTCCSVKDVDDARSAAYKLDMPYYVFNFTYDFEEKVIDKFIKSYKSGITPNPCIDCNRCMKFEKLYERARVLECDFIATGHYARIERTNDGFLLKKAVDEAKDQSYVLYSMTQEQLSRTLFPLGGLKKSQTRKIAENSGFSNAHKPDSQDICFVPDGDYAGVIEKRTGESFKKGNFTDASGNILGTHMGIIHYTVGQRRKLGLSFSEPMYVCKICADNNTVVLGREGELYGREAYLKDFNWISGKAPEKRFRCRVKIRYRQPEQWAVVTPNGDKNVHVLFDEPQRAITPGQAGVLYDGDIVLGGGVIR